ncbi:MAG: acetyltransferase [Gammaproteobacteria bacterium]|nr:acetyltransferase [Gammaproteobacteria bacterium]
MTYIDVFNGDADGLCALQQLRLAHPVDSTLITGVKRDIALLERVSCTAGTRVTVLDVSLDKNRAGLLNLLEAGAHVQYFDHHYHGEIPRHPHLETHLDVTSDRGTSLIVDDYLGGRFRAWAVVGTFGDNFDDQARKAGQALHLSSEDLERLRWLGVYLNYNGYGAAVTDLHIPPDALFLRMRPYADPLEFIERDEAFKRLESGYRNDMARAADLSPALDGGACALYVLPAAPWARRVSGVLANQLASGAPERAHALLTQLDGGGYVVSVRAPLAKRSGADTLCRQFASGGGREAAAGINHLAEEEYDRFVEAFSAAYC